MKRLFNISTIALALTVAFASCDKIESDDYLIFSGSTGEWYDGQPVADHTQRLLVEKYTGNKCTNCPDADQIISQIQNTAGDKMIAVSIHASLFSRPIEGNQDLRTDVGNTWYDFFGGPGLPAAMINRSKKEEVDAWNILGDSEMESGINAALSDSTNAKLAMDMSTEYDPQSRELTIRSNIEFLEDIAEPLTLTVLVMEDGIIGKQIHGSETLENYEFNHVFRGTITDLWGIDVNADGKTGTCRYIELNYTLPTEYVAENCHIVGFISNKETKEVIQCAETGVTE